MPTVFRHSKCGIVFVLWSSLTALADGVLVAEVTIATHYDAASNAACGYASA
jgi:hypothetical protein